MKRVFWVVFLLLLLCFCFGSCFQPLSTEIGDIDIIEKIEIVHIDKVIIPETSVVEAGDLLTKDEFIDLIKDRHISDVTDVGTFVKDMKKIDWNRAGHSLFVGEDIDAVKIYHKNGSVWWITPVGEAYFNVETGLCNYMGGTKRCDETQFAALIEKYS